MFSRGGRRTPTSPLRRHIALSFGSPIVSRIIFLCCSSRRADKARGSRRPRRPGRPRRPHARASVSECVFVCASVCVCGWIYGFFSRRAQRTKFPAVPITIGSLPNRVGAHRITCSRYNVPVAWPPCDFTRPCAHHVSLKWAVGRQSSTHENQHHHGPIEFTQLSLFHFFHWLSFKRLLNSFFPIFFVCRLFSTCLRHPGIPKWRISTRMRVTCPTVKPNRTLKLKISTMTSRTTPSIAFAEKRAPPKSPCPLNLFSGKILRPCWTLGSASSTTWTW